MDFSRDLQMGRAAGRRLHKGMTPVTVAHNPRASPVSADMTVLEPGQLK